MAPFNEITKADAGGARPGTPGAVPESNAERLTWRMAEIPRILGISRRALERERSAGRFPPPDLTIGRMPLWRVETIRAWVEGGGR
jgi:hypothetical protein